MYLVYTKLWIETYYADMNLCGGWSSIGLWAIIPLLIAGAGGSQSGKIMTFDREGRRFKSSNRRSAFPLGNLLLAAARSLKNGGQYYSQYKRKWKHKR